MAKFRSQVPTYLLWAVVVKPASFFKAFAVPLGSTPCMNHPGAIRGLESVHTIVKSQAFVMLLWVSPLSVKLWVAQNLSTNLRNPFLELLSSWCPFSPPYPESHFLGVLGSKPGCSFLMLSYIFHHWDHFGNESARKKKKRSENKKIFPKRVFNNRDLFPQFLWSEEEFFFWSFKCD